MNIIELLKDKSLKGIERRQAVVNMIVAGELSVGNMAAQYPDLLDYAIEPLMRNTSDEGTVIRWAAAYALSRIVILDRYAKSDLYNRLVTVCDREEDNGVKNQYLKALKKAAKIRK